MLHEASEAIRVVSNPFCSRIPTRRCRAASSCGAMIVAGKMCNSDRDVKEEDEWKGGGAGQVG